MRMAKYWCSIPFRIYHLAWFNFGFIILMSLWRKLKPSIRLRHLLFSTNPSILSKTKAQKRWLSECKKTKTFSSQLAVYFWCFSFSEMIYSFLNRKIKANQNSFAVFFYWFVFTSLSINAFYFKLHLFC